MKSKWVKIQEKIVSFLYEVILCYRKPALHKEQKKWVGKQVKISVYPNDNDYSNIGECIGVELRRKFFTTQWFVYMVPRETWFPTRGLYIEAIDKVQ